MEGKRERGREREGERKVAIHLAESTIMQSFLQPVFLFYSVRQTKLASNYFKTEWRGKMNRQ